MSGQKDAKSRTSTPMICGQQSSNAPGFQRVLPQKLAFCRIPPPLDLDLDQDVVIPRIRGVLTDEEHQSELDSLNANKAQLIAQELLPYGRSGSSKDPNEVSGSSNAFYSVAGSVMQPFQPKHPFPIQASYGSRKANTSVANATLGFRTNASAPPISAAPLVAPPLDRPSGLSHKTVSLRITRQKTGGPAQVKLNFAEKDICCSQDVVPQEAQWLPSWQMIEAAYNLNHTLKISTNDFDSDQVDAVSRFLAAYFAGPLHVAQALGEDTQETVDRIVAEFKALVSTLQFPDTLLGRRYSIVTSKNTSKEQGPGWRLRLVHRSRTGSQWSRNYRSEYLLLRHAKVLRAMMKDPEWIDRSAKGVWDAFQETIPIQEVAEEWLTGRELMNINSNDLRSTIVERIRLKPRRAPGVIQGCYRQELGQFCPAMGTIKPIKRLRDDYGLNLDHFGIVISHARLEPKACKEMVTGLECRDHYIVMIAGGAQKPHSELYWPEHGDERFVDPSGLRSATLPQTDTTLLSMGSPDIASTIALYVSCTDPSLVDQCAHTLRLIPDFISFASLPTSPLGSNASVNTVLDRTSILSGAMCSLDRIYCGVVLEDNRIAAHHPTNVRIVDWARNWARGVGHTARQADLLEAAVVVNNVLWAALGDALAQEMLKTILQLIEGCTEAEPHPAFYSRKLAYDYIRKHATAINEYQNKDAYRTLASTLPRNSITKIDTDQAARCRDLFSSLTTTPFDHHEGSSHQAENTEEMMEVDEASDDGASNGSESREGEKDPTEATHASEDEDTSDDQEAPQTLWYTRNRVNGIAKIAEERESKHGKTLTRQQDCLLPRLPWFPNHWTDSDVLTYADEADAMADQCDEVGGACPAPPPTGPEPKDDQQPIDLQVKA
ncbi:unnamed protein product [Sympodiomycopsis kandeliae]